jgi:hypothetical protein
VELRIRPWGEIYVDGQRVGVTPPLRTLEVAPGRRVIVVKNGVLPDYRTEVTVGLDQSVKLTHDFACISTREKLCPDQLAGGSGVSLGDQASAQSTPR